LQLLKGYDVILFDLDGTLTDPKLGITKSVQYSLMSFAINEPCLDKLVSFIGPPLMDSFQEYYGFDNCKAEEAVEKYREYFSVKGLYENAVYPFIPELLDSLRMIGKTLLVATSKPTVYAEKILDHFELRKYFSLVVGSNLDGSRVKKNEVIAYALEKMDLKEYCNVVMVGDRKHDIIGAKEAGIDSIGVLYGYGSVEEFEYEKPTYIVDTVLNLQKLLLYKDLLSEIKPGKYRHYKGKEYEVIGIARHSENLEEFVVYRALYGDGQLWIRPREMFSEQITFEGRKILRFEYIRGK
jgi:phosphoglycolate phosphatase